MFLTDVPVSLLCNGMGMKSRNLESGDYVNSKYTVKTDCFNGNVPLRSPCEYPEGFHCIKPSLPFPGQSSEEMASYCANAKETFQGESPQVMVYPPLSRNPQEYGETDTVLKKNSDPQLQCSTGLHTLPPPHIATYSQEDRSSTTQPLFFNHDEHYPHEPHYGDPWRDSNALVSKKKKTSTSLNSNPSVPDLYSDSWPHSTQYSTVHAPCGKNQTSTEFLSPHSPTPDMPSGVSMLEAMSSWSTSLNESNSSTVENVSNEGAMNEGAPWREFQSHPRFFPQTSPYMLSHNVESFDEYNPDYTCFNDMTHHGSLETSTDTSFTCTEFDGDRSRTHQPQRYQYVPVNSGLCYGEREKQEMSYPFLQVAQKHNDPPDMNHTRVASYGMPCPKKQIFQQTPYGYTLLDESAEGQRPCVDMKKRTKPLKKVQRSTLKDFLAPAPSKRKSRAGRKPLSGVFGICRQDSRWVVSYRDDENKSRHRYFVFQTEFEQLTQLVLAKRFLWRIVRLGRQLNPRDGEGLEEFVRNYDSDGTSEFLGVERTLPKDYYSYRDIIPEMFTTCTIPPAQQHTTNDSLVSSSYALQNASHPPHVNNPGPSYPLQQHTEPPPPPPHSTDNSLENDVARNPRSDETPTTLLHSQPPSPKDITYNESNETTRGVEESTRHTLTETAHGVKDTCLSHGPSSKKNTEVSTFHPTPRPGDESHSYPTKKNETDSAFIHLKRTCLTPGHKRSRRRLTSQGSLRLSKLPAKSNAFAAKAAHLRLVHSSLLTRDESELKDTTQPLKKNFYEPVPFVSYSPPFSTPQSSLKMLPSPHGDSMQYYDKSAQHLALSCWDTSSSSLESCQNHTSTSTTTTTTTTTKHDTFQCLDQTTPTSLVPPTPSLHGEPFRSMSYGFSTKHVSEEKQQETIDFQPVSSHKEKQPEVQNPLPEHSKPHMNCMSDSSTFYTSNPFVPSTPYYKSHIVGYQCKPLIMNVESRFTSQGKKSHYTSPMVPCSCTPTTSSLHLDTDHSSTPLDTIHSKSTSNDPLPLTYQQVEQANLHDSSQHTCPSSSDLKNSPLVLREDDHPQPIYEVSTSCKNLSPPPFTCHFNDQPASSPNSLNETMLYQENCLTPESHPPNENTRDSVPSLEDTSATHGHESLVKLSEKLKKFVTSEQLLRLEAIRCRYRKITLRYFTPHGGFRYLYVDRFTRVPRRRSLNVCLGSYTVPHLKSFHLT